MTRLRELLDGPGTVVAPGVYDGMTAALVRDTGFQVAYMSGAAVAASAVGLPDIGLATQSELVAQAVVINRQLRIPLIADADTGFGDIANAVRTVQEYERSGVAAIQLEDQEFPKRCGHLDQKRVVDAGEFADKIRACVENRTRGTLIVARTDARATDGIDEALRRAQRYVEAGADLIFVEAPQTVEEIAMIPANVGAPTVFNLVPSGKTPPVRLDQLQDWGYRVVIAPAACLAPAVTAARAALRQLRDGDLSTIGQNSPVEVFQPLGLDDWQRLQRFSSMEGSSA
ncbi:isocitrate lyase/PEP mutase family protein [Mycolicibacterium smegmatis]|uniref:isocitrate lyase/PEP mutase family protein n=1 Tax=Mycolicibacterium smegmatis TaxID=1772 RepID=UPI002357143D|nr:isocitrate lyase/PEP mutase family protein [Mycolicibacterium smegmatis]